MKETPSGTVRGLSHLTFIARDLDRMEEILVTALGVRRVYDSGEETFSLSPERFYLAGPEDGSVWIAVMRGNSELPRTYNHVAFSVAPGSLPRIRQKLIELGVQVRPPRLRIDGEGESLYFYDNDNHLFELHTGTLEERLHRYRQDPPTTPRRGDRLKGSNPAH